jgi:hypothetical protein
VVPAFSWLRKVPSLSKSWFSRRFANFRRLFQD